MHELSIALALVDIACEEAMRRGAKTVLAVHLAVGRLSGVAVDAIRSAFDLARSDTPIAGARLVVNEIDVTAECDRCGSAGSVVGPDRLFCGRCGSAVTRVLTGRELEVRGLEIAIDDADPTGGGPASPAEQE